MRIRDKRLALGALFSATLAALAAGCGDRPTAAPVSAATTTIGTEIDDTVVTAKVKAALLADENVKSFDLKVETRKGVVQLSGFVDNQAQVERAATTAAGVPGVNRIDNAVALKAGSETIGNAVDDGVVIARVRSALLSAPGVRSLDIAVASRKGDVQLSGFVDSQDQIEQAVALARAVEGVTGVGNELRVKQ